MTTAIVFPGQGSQSVGMLADLAAAWPVVQETFAEAAEQIGTDLWAMAQQGPADALADTRVTQPLMFVADLAVYRVLQQQNGVSPVAVAGHSLGEFAAMVASGALSFSDGLELVKRRAELMAAAVPDGEGGMAALLGMDDADVVAMCTELSGERVVEAVNFNAPGQVAISGHLDALEGAVAVARERGARKAMMLPVSVPNHSSLMRGAGEALAEHIDALTWHTPSVPLLQNATASEAASQADFLTTLRQHVYSPVQWTRTIESLRDRYAVELVIECGPGKVLTGLGKRIDRALPHVAAESPAAIESLETSPS